jgi:hypothetical protein
MQIGRCGTSEYCQSAFYEPSAFHFIRIMGLDGPGLWRGERSNHGSVR